MTDLSVTYMGLRLKNPLIAASSPLTASAAHIEDLAANGIGAVVLKSIFEEQIAGKAAMLERYGNYQDAADYLHAHLGADYLKGFTSLISDVKKKTDIPVIASINCTSGGKWTEFASHMADSGADALELNIYLLPADSNESSSSIEERYLQIIDSVARKVSIPISVKLSMRFTNIFHILQLAYNRGARAVVLYNRFFEPDIDIDRMEYVPASDLSTPSELHKSLRYIAIASAYVPSMDISVSTGVHSGADAVKSILAGARAVQLCSTLMINGTEAIDGINAFIAGWMEKNRFGTIEEFRGLMNKKTRAGDPLLERVQYMKTFPTDIF